MTAVSPAFPNNGEAGLFFSLLLINYIFYGFDVPVSRFCIFLTAKGKRGVKRGKRPWVFSPLVIKANERVRTHSRSALSEQKSGAPKNI